MIPKVLLIGNGLFRAYNGLSWNKLIKDIYCNSEVSLEDLEKVDFPLRAVLATGDKVDKAIKYHNDFFYGLDDVTDIRPWIEKLLILPFDHIITTNYSYEIERVADSRVKRDGKYCKNLARHTSSCKTNEGKYMLHTYNEVSFNGHKHKIWHIHGEARKPSSIILGHYYYGKLLAKIQNDLDERGNLQYWRQLKGDAPSAQSWVDAFIMGDVYTLGYGYDLSEMDMWWLLNRKKRENADHGKTIMLEPSGEKEIKNALFNAYDGIVENLGYHKKCEDYKSFYKDAIEYIEKEFVVSG